MNHTLKEIDLLKRALEKFRDNTGLQARIDAEEPFPPTLIHRYAPDARIAITHDHRDLTFFVEIKKQVDRFATLEAFNQLATYGGGMLVTEYLTPTLIDHCKKIRLPFLDAAGNAYLDERGVFVLIKGQTLDKNELRKTTPTRAFQRTGLKIVFALLTNPKILAANYREIMKAAGVALGAVGWVLGDLRERGLLTEGIDEDRRWLDRNQTIQKWVTNYPMRLRKHLAPKRYRAKNEDWWKTARPGDYGAEWGGEIAAAMLLGDFNPKTATVYVHGDRTAFLAAHRLRADETGPIEVLDAFWEPVDEHLHTKGLVDPLLVYADLQEIGDPRTYEQAKGIYDRYLA